MFWVTVAWGGFIALPSQHNIWNFPNVERIWPRTRLTADTHPHVTCPTPWTRQKLRMVCSKDPANLWVYSQFAPWMTWTHGLFSLLWLAWIPTFFTWTPTLAIENRIYLIYNISYNKVLFQRITFVGVARWDWICRMHGCDIFQVKVPGLTAERGPLSSALLDFATSAREEVRFLLRHFLRHLWLVVASGNSVYVLLLGFNTLSRRGAMEDFKFQDWLQACAWCSRLSPYLSPCCFFPRELYTARSLRWCILFGVHGGAIVLSGPAFCQRFPKPGAGSQNRDATVYNLGCLKTIQNESTQPQSNAQA